MKPAEDKLYLLLISVHGLLRGHNLELGRDADTGGQTKYVVELARALGKPTHLIFKFNHLKKLKKRSLSLLMGMWWLIPSL